MAPTKPKIIEGIPDVISIIVLIKVVNLLSFAYSFKYIAPPTPNGMAIISVIIMR